MTGTRKPHSHLGTGSSYILRPNSHSTPANKKENIHIKLLINYFVRLHFFVFTFIVLYRQVLRWSPLLTSIRMMRLCATPNSSSFLWPSNLMTNNVTPYSGRLCQAWMNFNFASTKPSSLTFVCASRMRDVA